MRNLLKEFPFTKWPKTIAFIVFSLGILATFLTSFFLDREIKKSELLQVKNETIRVQKLLEGTLNHGESATKTLAFLTSENMLLDNFDRICSDLIAQNQNIDALQIVQGDIIVNTYPIKNNEETIGYKVLQDTLHRREALKALKRRELYFEGPFELIQGGRGIVGRYPIFKNGKYWGFAGVILRMETLHKVLEVDENGKNNVYQYQLVKSSNGEDTVLFFPQVEDYESGIYYSEHIRIGDWNLFVKLLDNKSFLSSSQFFISGMLISILLSIFTYYLLIQPKILREQVEHQTQELKYLNHELKLKADELISINTELEQFAFITSHDLQEPLRMITSFLQQIEKNYGDKLDEKGKKYIRIAVENSRRMRQMILDILHYSLIDKDEFSYEEVDMNQLINDYIHLKEIAEEIKFNIHFNNLPIINVPKILIHQLFYNLLDNAIKYRKKDVTPEITISVREDENNWKFTIQDNGIGMDEENFEKIFVIFQRLHGKDEYQGTGVGLAIVKKILTRLDGQIDVESALNVGTTFHITLKKHK